MIGTLRDPEDAWRTGPTRSLLHRLYSSIQGPLHWSLGVSTQHERTLGSISTSSILLWHHVNCEHIKSPLVQSSKIQYPWFLWANKMCTGWRHFWFLSMSPLCGVPQYFLLCIIQYNLKLCSRYGPCLCLSRVIIISCDLYCCLFISALELYSISPHSFPFCFSS